MHPTDEALARVHEAMGTRTQIELAEGLGIRQSSISDAKRRGSIPFMWLVKVAIEKFIHPTWVLTGQGPKFLIPSEDGKLAAESARRILPRELTKEELVAQAGERLDASDLLGLLREAGAGWNIELRFREGSFGNDES